MGLNVKYLENKVCLNVLVNSVDNAKECYEAAEGHIVLGVLSKNYPTNEAAINDMKLYQEAVNNAISVGLGAGDPKQSWMVAEISKVLQPQHVNQVFTGAGLTRGMLGQNTSVVNGLVSPTGKVGYVNVATGPLSSLEDQTEVPVRTAIQMLKDMGCSSIKFFPMKGLSCIDEYREVAKACAELDFMLEPTGGLDLDNFEEVVKIALDAGVKKVIPHVYSSIIDPETGDTRPHQVKELYEIMQKLVK